ILIDGKIIYIFTTHLQSGKKTRGVVLDLFKKIGFKQKLNFPEKDLNMVKLKQMIEIKKFIKKFANNNDHTIILGGDFNLSEQKTKIYLDKINEVFLNKHDHYIGESKASVWNSNQKLDHIWVINNSNVIGLYNILDDIKSNISDHKVLVGIYKIETFK
ncbi:hypothetical protein LCGC14_2075450, partial [marine sediment metagenome]